jgi:hypothetical protein
MTVFLSLPISVTFRILSLEGIGSLNWHAVSVL